MSGFKLNASLSLNKKSNGLKKPTNAFGAKKKPTAFGNDDSDSDDASSGPFAPANKSKSKGPIVPQKNEPTAVETITELDDDTLDAHTQTEESRPAKSKKKLPVAPVAPPSLKGKKKVSPEGSGLGDLSSALESRKYIEAAQAEDANIYDYDAVYDALKPQAKRADAASAEEEAKPRYITGIVAAAAVRKRDQLAAEQVKVMREREEEGDEFADKEVFVTESYKKAQEAKKKEDAELKIVEEEELKRREGGAGMTDFYKRLLDEKEEEHRRVVEAAARRSKMTQEERDKEDQEKKEADEKSMADRAREINELGGNIAINDDGEVVDKRQLLKGGLNMLPSRRANAASEAQKKARQRAPELMKDTGRGGQAGGRRGMRERQSKMVEEQLEMSLKRAREEEEKERERVENMNKSTKTEADISGARERFLARKRAAEEAKKAGTSA